LSTKRAQQLERLPPGGAHNIGTIDRVELIAASGNIAEQIKDLPDGTKIRLKITD
jgi:hypothetical protein